LSTCGEPVVLLEVDDQVGLRLAAHFGERLDVLRAVDGDAHQVAAGLPDRLGLLDRGVDVLRARGAHALDRYRVARAERHRADADLTSGITFHSNNLFYQPTKSPESAVPPHRDHERCAERR
jgi:hypothetical protein